jgi:3-dehydroquinate dehydratase-1
MIDVEWNPKYPWRDIVKNVRKYNLALMISHHDYTGTPSEKQLIRLARAAYSKKADVVKIAARVKDDKDIRTLLELNTRFAPKKLMTVMGMGPLGTLSRLVGPLFHSCFVYGFIGTPTASGQLPFRELQDRIRTLYPRYEVALQSRQAKLVNA